MLMETWRRNADALRRVGEQALKAAREARVPAYYSDPSLGEGLIKEMPDGSRFRVAVAGDDDVILETVAPRR